MNSGAGTESMQGRTTLPVARGPSRTWGSDPDPPMTITAFLRHRRAAALAAVFAGFACVGAAHAEVKQSAADGFLLAYSVPVAATPAKAWTELAQVQHWWSDEHTWSGKDANLSLQPTAGGCFCERWPQGSAEHGHVVMALPERLLRLDAVLGPLQEFALKGMLSIWIKAGEDGKSAVFDVEYRVNGAAASGLDQLAPQVDAVLGAQIGRLQRYVDTGHPDEPAPSPEQQAQTAAEQRAAILEQWKASAAAEAPAAKTDVAPVPAAKSAAKPKPKPRKPKPADEP